MSKHIDPAAMYNLPSGLKIHPCRLILKDGTLMWKHALLYNNKLNLPQTEAHEVHIQKTAQRLEELNSWVSQDLEPWNCFSIIAWYAPSQPELADGISVYFKHSQLDNNKVYDLLKSHIQEHESLDLINHNIFFKRC